MFDEGHHLPDKAIGHFAHFTRLRATADWLEQIAKNLTKLLAQHPLPGDLGRLIEQVPELAREIKTQQQFMFTACEEIGDFRAGEDMEGRERPRHRFVGGVVPEHIREMGIELKKGFSKLTDLFTRLTDILKEAMDGEGAGGIASHQAEEWYPLFGSLGARPGQLGTVDRLHLRGPAGQPADGALADPRRERQLLRHRSQRQPDPRRRDPAPQPVERRLWRAGDLGDPDRVGHLRPLPHARGPAAQRGHRGGAEPFHHAEAGVLRVPDLKADPRNAAEHTAAIIRELPELVKGARGSLVLFSSRKQMQEVFDGLDRDWRKRVFIQGNLSKQETLNKHKSRVDDGEDSVLFGLASFAEGVDLPGAYCEHVVIAKIPFAVPDDPVEAALAEWIEARGNPFMEIAVPDASLRLVQACGRLLRTEQDRGTITLLDRRVVTQRYGKAILNALPPFRREIA